MLPKKHETTGLGDLFRARLEQVKRLKDLELENSRLRKAISDLTLDKLILQEAARGNF
jgi:putative transposase